MLKLYKKPLILTLSTFILIGCSSKNMYTTGTTLEKILPRGIIKNVSTTLITNPLKANEEEKMRKIAEAKRLDKERKYKEWWSSLSKEEQQEVIAKKERIAAQNRRMIGNIFEAVFSSAANSSPNTLDPLGDARIYKPYSR